jgi:hypothetical protein
MLLHEKKDEDGVKNFFNEVYELYLKVPPQFTTPAYQIGVTEPLLHFQYPSHVFSI